MNRLRFIPSDLKPRLSRRGWLWSLGYFALKAPRTSDRLGSIILILICAAAIALTVPTIANNISDPNAIVYFNADEGGLMDEIWYYYSGVKRDSFQWNIDYGLEMVYVSDLARIFLSKFMEVTPGMFVLILRWIHLLAWIGALIALWCLIGRHFRKGWGQVLAVLLLASRPAFPYLLDNLKPEPLVLLLIIMGIDRALRIIESPSSKNIALAVACAAAALVIKFSGIFLLPVIVAALYFSDLCRKAPGDKGPLAASWVKYSWIFPALLSIPLIAAPLAAIFFYVRHSTGNTFYQSLGLKASIAGNHAVYLIWSIAAVFIGFSLLLFLLNRSRKPFIVKAMRHVNYINAYAIKVGLIFIFMAAALGARWFTMPRHLITTYAYNGMDFIGWGAHKAAFSSAGPITGILSGVWEKILSFDPIVFFLLMVYVLCELRPTGDAGLYCKTSRYKRLSLLVFMLPFFASLFTSGRFAGHHMLPFFTVAVVLAIQGTEMIRGRRSLRPYLFVLALLLLASDIGINALQAVKARLHAFNQREDIAFEIKEWWKENIPPDARVASEHYIYLYIPEGYKNLKTIDWSGIDSDKQLRNLVEEYRPSFIYVREAATAGNGISDIRSVLADKRLKLVKMFDGSSGKYQRSPGEKYLLFEVVY